MTRTRLSRICGTRPLVVLLVFTLLVVSACAGGGSSRAPGDASKSKSAAPSASGSKEPLKIGAVFDISGRASFYGNAHRDSALLAVEEINGAGGVNGRPLELIIYDGESDETKSLLALRRLIDQDKVLAVMGPSLTGTVLAAADTLTRAGIASITPAAGSNVFDPVKPWIFSISQNDRFTVAKGLQFLKKKNITRLGMLAESTSFGTQARDEIVKQAPDLGMTIVASETFGDKDVDVTPQLTSLKGRQLDGIIIWGSSPTCAIAAKNARQLGITIPMMQGSGVASQSFIDTAGEGAEGQYIVLTKLFLGDQLPDAMPEKAKIQHFRSVFQTKYQRPADSLGANIYDGLYLLTDALKRAEPERKAIRDALEKTKDFLAVNGSLTLGPDRHNAVGPDNFIVGIIKGGKFLPAE